MENQVVMSEKALLKREALLNASLEHFNKQGFHTTRIEDIIKLAGVGKGTFYLYFKNKEDVVLNILDDFLHEIESTLNWVQLNIEDVQSLRNLFLEEAAKLTDSFVKNLEAARFLFREGKAVSRDVEKRINTHINQVIKASEETYEFALSLGILKNINASVSAMAVVGGVSQIYYQWLDGQIQEDINVVVEGTVDFYLNALGLTSPS
jgi:AcrR family transcriptional regulator